LAVLVAVGLGATAVACGDDSTTTAPAATAVATTAAPATTAGAATTAAGTATSAKSAVSKEDWQKVVDAAKTEGTVALDISMPENNLVEVAKIFTQETGLKLSYRRMLSADQRPTQEQEITAGQEKFDIVVTLNPNEFKSWREKGRLVDLSTSLPSYYALPDNWKFKETLGWTGSPFFLGYNTQAVGSNVPKDWTALTDPAFKGKVAAIDPRTGSSFQAATQMLLDKYGKDFITGWGANKPQLFRASSEAAQALASGQLSLLPFFTLSYLPGVPGAPISFVKSGFYPSNLNELGIYSKAKHPNAAKVFMEWAITSKALQKYLATIGLFPQVEGDLGQYEPLLKGITVADFDFIKAADYGQQANITFMASTLGFS
jgi:ABC-type Fe3+ transport system substrate-binding protein